MTTLITGASGFVGSSVLRCLLEAGHEMRALVRSASDHRNLDGLDVELVPGDLTDPASLARAVKGCRFVFHVAAYYRLWVRSPRSMYQINVEGTKHLLQAAMDAGVERIVYTSSVATLGHHRDATPADENTPVALSDMIGHYHRSKYLAESQVAQFVADKGAPVVIVNPSAPVGPRDVKPTPTGQLIRDAAAGKMPAFVNTGLNIVHVDDVAQGHLLALNQGRIGRRYILGGTNMTLKAILQKVSAASGRRPPRICLPHGAVLPVAYVAQVWARVFGGEPVTTVDGVKLSREYMYFSSARAQRELDYRPRPAEEALSDSVTWFRDNGYLS